MPDILIRDLPDEVVAAIDANAKHFGVSRTSYLRRVLAREQAVRASREVTEVDWERFHERTTDLRDPEVMKDAWS